MRLRAIAILGAAFLASVASAGAIEDRIVQQLKDQGFTEIEMSRTWLGRVRIEAESGTHEREIILNPRTGEILRDYWEGPDHSAGPQIVNPHHAEEAQEEEGYEDEREDYESAEDDPEDDVGDVDGEEAQE